MSVIRNLKGLGLLLAIMTPVLLIAGAALAQDASVSVSTGGASPAPAPAAPAPVPVNETGATAQPSAQPGELPPLPASSQGASNFESGGRFEAVERPEMVSTEETRAMYHYREWTRAWKDGKYMPPAKRRAGEYNNTVYAFAGIAPGQTYYLESHYPKKKTPASARVGKTADGTDLYSIGAFGNFHTYTRIR